MKLFFNIAPSRNHWVLRAFSLPAILILAANLGCSRFNATQRSRQSADSSFPGADFHAAGTGPLDIEFSLYNGSCWTYVDDKSAVFLHPNQPWPPSAGLCSTAEFLSDFDTAYAQFHALYPGVRPVTVIMRMNAVKPVWSEMLSSIRADLARKPRGSKSDGDYPLDFTGNTGPVDRALNDSPKIAAIDRHFNSLGLTVEECGTVDFITVRKPYIGRPWPYIATLPDAGMAYPGLIEFDFKNSSKN